MCPKNSEGPRNKEAKDVLRLSLAQKKICGFMSCFIDPPAEITHVVWKPETLENLTSQEVTGEAFETWSVLASKDDPDKCLLTANVEITSSEALV